MASIEDVDELVREFSARFKSEANFEAKISGAYFLLKEPLAEGLGWPDPWPHGKSPGIYAILHEKEVLYVGKASLQWIGDRLSNYFHYGEDRKCVHNPKHTWKKPPTHVISWAIPQEQCYEASALEEFIIGKLQKELTENTQGVST